ncbi:MAG: type IV secretory system conjugative DNA transfer family protein [Minisyncoccota bacterium]
MEYISPDVPKKFKSPEEEIAYLRDQVSARENELREKKVWSSNETAVSEQISKYKDKISGDVLHENYVLPDKKIEEVVLNLAPELHDKKMSELLGLMQTKGVKNTLSVLSALRDPHLEDDFHRMLVQYLQGGYPVKSVPEKIAKAGDMVMYEVILPEAVEGNTRSPKETVSAMQQFLSGMDSISSSKNDKDNYFTLEIANAEGSEQFIFYVSVPHYKKDLFEKQITSVFPGVKFSIDPNDYNIFNEDGVSVGGYLTLKETALLPIKTIEDFDIDPLTVILNTFSKIKKVGEGAALQIVIKPSGDTYDKHFKSALSLFEKGTPLKEALGGSFIEGFGQALKNLIMPIKNDPDKPVNTEHLASIKRKISEKIYPTNIRIITSGNSRQEAEKILGEIESSLNQFSKQHENMFSLVRLEKGAFAKFSRDFSFRIYNEDITCPLNSKEIGTFFHFPNSSYSVQPQLKTLQSISAPAPQDLSTEGIVIGVNSYRNVDTTVHMSPEDRLRHFYSIGQTGTGKSTLLKNMAIQDIQNGEGVCVIDPHGVDILDILANIPKNRIDDVIYFDPSYVERPMALNMLEYDINHPEQKTFVVNELFNIFQKLYGGNPESMGPMFEQYFRNATMLVIEDPETGNTLLDVSRVMADKKFRDLKISRCKNPIVVQFWTEVAEKAGGEASLANIVPYITSKFDVFLANDVMRPLIAQEKSSFDFRDIMDNKKILLVNLAKGRLGDINANLVGLILVGKILMAALSRVDSLDKGFPPFYLYIDEFQNITTNSIATILSEARKYKLVLNITHQFIAQIEQNIRDAVFGNVGSICSFRTGAEDAEYLEKQFSPVFSAKDIMNIDNRNAVIKMLVNGKPVKAFNIQTLPPPKGEPGMIDSLKHLSYLTYGGDKEEIDRKILAKYKK